MNNKKLLKYYEKCLKDFRIEKQLAPWYHFIKRYKLKKEIEKYKLLCLMTHILQIGTSNIK